jgi:ankyrin repeat protein
MLMESAVGFDRKRLIKDGWTDLMIQCFNWSKCSPRLGRYLVVGRLPEPSLDAIQNLIKQRPEDIDKVNNDGFTALLFAVESEASIDVVETLLSVGANVNHVARNINALMLCPSPEVIQILFDAGIDIDYRDQDGCSALMYYGNIRELVRLGCNLDFQSHNGTTALMASVRNWDNLRVLIDAGAKLDIQDSTPH